MILPDSRMIIPAEEIILVLAAQKKLKLFFFLPGPNLVRMMVGWQL